MSDDPKASGDSGQDDDFAPPGEVTRDRLTSGRHDEDSGFGRPGGVGRDYFTKGAPQKPDPKNKG